MKNMLRHDREKIEKEIVIWFVHLCKCLFSVLNWFFNMNHLLYVSWMMQLRYNDTAETIKVGGIKYKLKQLHWHSPSEHTINGQRLHVHCDIVVNRGVSIVLSVCTRDRFAMELHMVHFTEDGNITVVAILYRYGKPDPFLFQVNLCDRNKDWLYHLSSMHCILQDVK